MTSSPTSGMDPGVRSHGMKADPPGYLWSKYECFLMGGWWDILHSSCLNVKLWSNSMNGMEVWTNEQMNERAYERKDKNYIPLGIKAGGIKTKVSNDKLFTPIRCLSHAWILCWLECVNTRNIPHLFKPFLRCKKRMCIAVNEWPKENVRLISRNFWIWMYLFIISNTYSYFI